MQGKISRLLRHGGHNINSIRLSLQLAEQYDIDKSQLLQDTGLDLDAVEDISQMADHQQELTVLRNLVQLTGDPLIGLKVGDLYQNSAFGLFGYVILHSPTLRAAIANAYKYLDLSYAFFDHECRVENDATCWVAKPALPLEGLQRVLLERELACVQQLFGQALKRIHWIDRIEIAGQDDTYLTAYQVHFNCPVKLSSDGETRLFFDPALLDKTLPFYRADLHHIFVHQCDIALGQLDDLEDDLRHKVRALLVAQPGFMPNLEQVAEQLHVSSRTLRRRLGEKGISFRELLKETRLGLAKEYLLNSDLTIDQLAERLGYSEASNFSNAFKNWCGVGPKTFKQQAQLATSTNRS